MRRRAKARDRWNLSGVYEDQRVQDESIAEVLLGTRTLQSRASNEPNHRRVLEGGQRGRFITLFKDSFLDGNKVPVDILELRGDTNEARALTVSCFIEQLGNDRLTQPVIGFLEFGSAGVQAKAEFDFINGVTFSLHGSYIRISAAMDINFSTSIDFSDLNIGAFASYGTDVSSAARLPQKSFFTDSFLINTGPVIRIPTFAHQVTVLRKTGLPYLMRFIESDGTFLYEENFALDQNAAPVLIGNKARNLAIINGGPTATEFTVIFDLAL